MSDAVWRSIVDTNTLVSAVCFPISIPARVVDEILRSSILLVSSATLSELNEVLNRPKFDRYVSAEGRGAFFRLIMDNAKLCEIESKVILCRDPKDHKFLNLAIDAKADFLITGDKDLLALNPFGNLQIIKPADFLAR